LLSLYGPIEIRIDLVKSEDECGLYYAIELIYTDGTTWKTEVIAAKMVILDLTEGMDEA
jgi:hypothetical protein